MQRGRGFRLFSDNAYERKNQSKLIDENIWFKLSWKDVRSSSISVTSNEDLAVFLAIWELEERESSLINSLQDEGWFLKNELEIWWNYVDLSWKLHEGKTKAILVKLHQAGDTLSFNRPENHAPTSIFVLNRRLKLFHPIYTYGVTYRLIWRSQNDF